MIGRLGASLQVTLLVGGAGVGFALSMLLLARVMDPGDFGRVTLGISIVNVAFPLATLGLDGIVVRHRLTATRSLLGRVVRTSLAVALLGGMVAAIGYDLPRALAFWIALAIAGGGVMYLASMRYQSLEQFPIAITLGQSSNFVLLATAVVALGLGRSGDTGPLAAIAIGHVVAAIGVWWVLLRRDRDAPAPPSTWRWGEALSLAGATGATLLLLQLERLLVPHVLDLDRLAELGVIAAVVLSPYRMLQSGVQKSLLPRLRNAPDAAARRAILTTDLRVVCGLLVVGTPLVWVLTPIVVELLVGAGKYPVDRALVLAAIVSGIAKVATGAVDALVSATLDARGLAVWNLVGWGGVAVAIVGGVVGAEVGGLPGVLYGVALGWLGRSVSGIRMARRPRR